MCTLEFEMFQGCLSEVELQLLKDVSSKRTLEVVFWMPYLNIKVSLKMDIKQLQKYKNTVIYC